MFYVQGPSEAWYPPHGLLKIKENVQIVSRDFGTAEDRHLVLYFLSPC
jgi:hypothetical protein